MATAPTATTPGRVARGAAGRVSLWRTPRTRALLLVATIGAVVAPVVVAAHLYTDVLWFRELGQERVFWTTTAFRVLVPAAVGLGTTCALLADIALAERLTRRSPPPRGARAPVWQHRRLLQVPVAIAGGVVELERHGGAWQSVLLWSHRVAFGARDPLFRRDIGFFVFSLPLHQQVAAWLLETVVMAAVIAVACYALAGVRPARAHLLWLLALALVVMAWRLRLDRFALALPHPGAVVAGATYTDVHVRLPMLQALTFASLAGAALAGYGAVRRLRPLPLVALAAGALLVLGAGKVLPWAVQRFAVAPQVLGHERPYLADAIAGTRRAFQLDRVRVRPLPAASRLGPADLEASRPTIENVPLWDKRVLRPAMNELQGIGGYYRFPSTSIDRYTIGGVPRVAIVGARELDLSRVRPSDRTWTNTRFAYTHGYGVVAAETGRATADRYPRFAARAFDAANTSLGLRQPRTYFGERTGPRPPYTVLDSHRGEVEQPAPGSQAPTYHYDGPGGIPLSGVIRRAAFAIRFWDLKLLLTGTATPSSRIVLHRSAGARVRMLAPFLRWDAQPQTAVVDGHVQFLFHGYTTSDHYPYSAPVQVAGDRVNFLRASALAAVDSFTGSVHIYAVDDADPILRAWMSAYPTLFEPAARMSADLRAHLRYPGRLFTAQAAAYATYHADDVTGFWNGADAWQPSRQLSGPAEDVGEIQFPQPAGGGELRPRYLLARLPGDRRERFLLTASFTPRGRQNIVGYLAGSVDGLGRPHLTLLSLPRDRLTIGPSQATREILSAPAVTRRLELLNRESRDLGKNSVNRTVLGGLRVVPVGDALVEVQPVYVTAGGSGLPRLQLVTTLANGRVGYGRDLMSALRRAVRSRGAPAPATAAGGARPRGRPGPRSRR